MLKVLLILLGTIFGVMLVFRLLKSKPKKAILTEEDLAIEVSKAVSNKQDQIVNWDLLKKKYLTQPQNKGVKVQTLSVPIVLWLLAIIALALGGYALYQENQLDTRLSTRTDMMITQTIVGQKKLDTDVAAFKTAINTTLDTRLKSVTDEIAALKVTDGKLGEVDTANKQAIDTLNKAASGYATKTELSKVTASIPSTSTITDSINAQKAATAKMQSDITAGLNTIKPYNDTDVKTDIKILKDKIDTLTSSIQDLKGKVLVQPTPQPVSIYVMQESYLQGENESYNIYGNIQIVGETYTPANTIILDKVRVRMMRADNILYGSIYLSIWLASADGYAYQNAPLTQAVVNSDKISVGIANSVEFDIDDFILQGGTTYVIAITVPGAPLGKVNVMVANPGYAPGFMVAYTSSWNKYPSKDLTFEIIRK